MILSIAWTHFETTRAIKTIWTIIWKPGLKSERKVFCSTTLSLAHIVSQGIWERWSLRRLKPSLAVVLNHEFSAIAWVEQVGHCTFLIRSRLFKLREQCSGSFLFGQSARLTGFHIIASILWARGRLQKLLGPTLFLYSSALNSGEKWWMIGEILIAPIVWEWLPYFTITAIFQTIAIAPIVPCRVTGVSMWSSRSPEHIFGSIRTIKRKPGFIYPWMSSPGITDLDGIYVSRSLKRIEEFCFAIGSCRSLKLKLDIISNGSKLFCLCRR